MSKTRNKVKRRTLILMTLCSLGFSYGSVEAGALNRLFDNIIKATEKSRPIDQVFDGKASTENVYRKALDMIKTETVTTVRTSIEQVAKVISEQSNSYIDPQDIRNITYDSSISATKFANTNQIVNQDNKIKISPEEISASYSRLSKKINTCIALSNQQERTCIRDRISKQYRAAEQNYTDIHSFKEQSYGEDLFTNGTTDDSDYDILVDIKNISKILFTSFISPTETLFYKLPKSSSSSIGNTFSAIINAVGGNNSPEIMGTFGNTTTSSNGTTTATNTTGTGNPREDIDNGTNTDIEDTDPRIAGFITKTNTTSKTTSTTQTTNNTVNLLGIAQGNICIPSVSAGNSSTITTTDTEIKTTTIQEYLNEIDKKVNRTTPTVNYTPEDFLTGGSNDPDPIEIARMNELIEAKINSIFDPVSTKACTTKCGETASAKRKSCIDQGKAREAMCNEMSLVDRTICTKNSKSIEATCKESIIPEETMCTIECLCFTTQYPKAGLGLEGMEGQIKLRFCSIPVQKNRISKGKDILGRDDSLTRIKATFENLLNGGEMIKYERNKEYLDSPLGAVKRDKIISFDILIYMKGLFPSISDKARKTEIKKIREDAEKNSKGDPKDSNMKNENKLISDSAIVAAGQNISTTYSDFQTQVKQETEKLSNKQRKTFEAEILKNSKNVKNIIFNEQMNSFLKKNSEIRSSIMTEMIGFQGLGTALNTAVKGAK